MSVQDAAHRPPSGSPDDRVVELSSGVDALYFSGYGVPPPGLIDELDRLQALAVTEHLPQPIDLDGFDFMVQPHGWRQYTYLLVHPFGRIGISTSEQFPAYRIQPLSVALHGLGAEGAVAWFEAAVRSFDRTAQFKVSRLDLYCDVQGWLPVAACRDRMVCRSRNVTVYEVDAELTGLVFGKRKTAGVMLRIYDKKRDVFDHGHDYLYPVWGDRFDPTLPVWRVEFEIGRKKLLEYGIDSTASVFDRIGGVWADITTGLYRLCVETSDHTKSRWPTDPVWALVQNATLRDGAQPIERLLEYKRLGTLRTLAGPLTGVLSSVGALTAAESVDDVLDHAYDMVERYSQWTGRSFMDRVEEKKRR